MLTIQSRFAFLTDPIVKVQTTPAKPELVEEKIGIIHAAVKERVCKHLKPLTGGFSTKLLYSLPIVLLGKILSPTHAVVATGIGAGYLWGRGAQMMSQESRVLVLHTTALAFFINAMTVLSQPVNTALVKIPLNLAVSGLSLTLANMIEADAIATAQAEKAAKAKGKDAKV